jgi:hypothetical protein
VAARRGHAVCPTLSSTLRLHPRAHTLRHATGALPRKYNVKQPTAYALLVNHVRARLWDYDACVESQLKVWLAHHLLRSANARCSMWDASAARPIADAPPRARDGRLLGPYSCSLEEAGEGLRWGAGAVPGGLVGAVRAQGGLGALVSLHAAHAPLAHAHMPSLQHRAARCCCPVATPACAAEVLQRLWAAQPDEAAQAPMPYARTLRELLCKEPYYDLRRDASGTTWVRLRVEHIKELLNY